MLAGDGPEARVETGRAYRAFISYSHADREFADWLHRRLERYALPTGIGTAGALRPIFIDRAELVAGGDLTAQVKGAIEASAALVIVASPAARASRWVNQEVELFRAIHPDRPVLIALLDGEPEESFPEALVRSEDGFEPVAADFRETGDGKRLGLLKLVAGLAGVGLDRLVQRDAQIRFRRVMAVTVAAVAIALVTTALAVTALRARDEARRQRNGSEALVEFMLTDLRQRLKGVGRLDVMDAVNDRAMAYYAAEERIASLPEDSLERRARLLAAMGEDDLAAGKHERAEQEFTQAYRTTADLLRRKPDDPERIFSHAQSEFWLGNQYFLSHDKQRALTHWLAYRDFASRLVRSDAASVRFRRELGSAEANLCALALAEPRDPASALEHCRAASTALDAVAEALPGDVSAQIDNATQVAWSADAEAASGNVDAALALRRQQNTMAESLESRFPGDSRVRQARLLAAIGLGEILARARRDAEARGVAEQARALADRLKALDPQNRNWANWRQRIDRIDHPADAITQH